MIMLPLFGIELYVVVLHKIDYAYKTYRGWSSIHSGHLQLIMTIVTSAFVDLPPKQKLCIEQIFRDNTFDKIVSLFFT